MAGISLSDGLPLSGVGLYNAENELRRARPDVARRYPMTKTLYVLNGPSMDLGGARAEETDGRASLADIEELCHKAVARFALGIEFRHSNHEDALVDWIHEGARNAACGILINPAGCTTTWGAIPDAIRAVPIPVVEVHISNNIHARDDFRRRPYMSQGPRAVICGFGVEGYALAIIGLATMVGAGVNN
jgi:3-dehydroquinate dehydratase II